MRAFSSAAKPARGKANTAAATNERVICENSFIILRLSFCLTNALNPPPETEPLRKNSPAERPVHCSDGRGLSSTPACLLQRRDLESFDGVLSPSRFKARVFGRERRARSVCQVNTLAGAGHFAQTVGQIAVFRSAGLDGPIDHIGGRCRYFSQRVRQSFCFRRKQRFNRLCANRECQ